MLRIAPLCEKGGASYYIYGGLPEEVGLCLFYHSGQGGEGMNDKLAFLFSVILALYSVYSVLRLRLRRSTRAGKPKSKEENPEEAKERGKK